MKRSTLYQVVERIIAEGEATWENDIDAGCGLDESLKEEYMGKWFNIANEAVICITTAVICERDGIDKAMEYYFGSHHAEEYLEYLKPKPFRPEHLKRMGVTMMEGENGES